jgi:hypothetical protein
VTAEPTTTKTATTTAKTTSTTKTTTITAETTITTTPNSDGLNRSEVERLVHRFVNRERTERALDPLAFDTELRKIVRSHSEDMATRGYFSHASPEGENFADRYERSGYTRRAPTGDGSYLTGGENIAQTWYDTAVTTDGGTVRHTTERELARGIVNQWDELAGSPRERPYPCVAQRWYRHLRDRERKGVRDAELLLALLLSPKRLPCPSRSCGYRDG